MFMVNIQPCECVVALLYFNDGCFTLVWGKGLEWSCVFNVYGKYSALGKVFRHAFCLLFVYMARWVTGLTYLGVLQAKMADTGAMFSLTYKYVAWSIAMGCLGYFILPLTNSV